MKNIYSCRLTCERGQQNGIIAMFNDGSIAFLNNAGMSYERMGAALNFGDNLFAENEPALLLAALMNDARSGKMKDVLKNSVLSVTVREGNGKVAVYVGEKQVDYLSMKTAG